MTIERLTLAKQEMTSTEELENFTSDVATTSCEQKMCTVKYRESDAGSQTNRSTVKHQQPNIVQLNKYI